MKKLLPLLALIALLNACQPPAEEPTVAVAEQEEDYRPQFHFTPQQGWMNDPNGMILFNDTYHLFYQYYPDSTVWGPMHWGHATSPDLLHWEHQPIALYPDSLGYIFSGSAIADSSNSSRLGRKGIIPLIAMYTTHDTTGEKAGNLDFQNQCIAYSLDSGHTWVKYKKNPVLRNPGIRDFRDPKLCWFAAGKKWIMTLAVDDHISFYSSRNLLQWKKESDFGKEAGAHGGVWECPDLISFDDNGKEVWVLIVNINPGGPNGGSATQYFTGHFDGSVFQADHTNTKWLDYGPDEYAGITWSNTGNRKIFLGWMSNWQYAQVVPTKKWRSAMTIPRDLRLENINGAYLLASTASPEINALKENSIDLENLSGADVPIAKETKLNQGVFQLMLHADQATSFSLNLSNTAGDKLLVGYDRASNQYYIDRTQSGLVDFDTGFAKKLVAPRFVTTTNIDMVLFVDKTSIELFADGGLTAMTAIFFPKQPFSSLSVTTLPGAAISNLTYTALKSTYKADK